MSAVAIEAFQGRTREPEAPLDGLDGLVHGWAGGLRGLGRGRRLWRQARQIRARAEQARGLDDETLRRQLAEAAGWFRRHRRPDRAQVMAALALIVEAADRTLGRRPYRVQIMGALALHHGTLAQMATGEGKTLTAGVAGVMAAWTGQPCHIATANDYLVSRDAGLLAPLYEFCGLTVGAVTAGMDTEARRQGYGCSITYATGKELLADFLRDRLLLDGRHETTRRMLAALQAPDRFGAEALVMRGLGSAIVDEADSLLIDEAVTPLIISAPDDDAPLREGVLAAHAIAAELGRGQDYLVDLSRRLVRLTERGRSVLDARADRLPEMWRGPSRREDLICQALTARELFELEQHYVVIDGKVVIVDAFTGRMMPGRTWSTGLHQAIEAKEGVALTAPMDVRARMSFQSFFRRYRRLAGMTGTAERLGGELWRVYGLAVVRIPTHRPCRRRVKPDRFCTDQALKWQAVAETVSVRHATGQPVLIGTRSIMDSELLTLILAEWGVRAHVLNALHHEEEAEIVRNAGQLGQVTIATNMAGRGTDIGLGAGVAELGGLHVIATERHESRRVDLQLYGRSARQGDPGSAEAILSLEDALFERFLPRPLLGLLAPLCHLPGGGVPLRGLVSWFQHRAERAAVVQRRRLLQSDHHLRDALAFTGDGG